MQKKFFIAGLILIFIFINIYTSVCFAETVTLAQIVTVFNNCSTVKRYAESGIDLNATNTDDKITISITENEQTSEAEYVLTGTILTGNFLENELTKGLTSIILADCIGQIHGYNEGDVMTTLNQDEAANYTVENEGFEIKQLSDGSYQVKIDIEKKIPLIDVSGVYIQVSDLADLKEYISGDGSAQQSKGNIVFHKSGYGKDVTVFVGEKDKLTTNTYNSIISVLTVMFDSEDVTNYFRENYPNISTGNKEFSGFKIEVNPEKTTAEEVILGDDDTYKFIRLTIDKDVVNSTVSGNNVDNNNGNNDNNNQNESNDNNESNNPNNSNTDDGSDNQNDSNVNNGNDNQNNSNENNGSDNQNNNNINNGTNNSNNSNVNNNNQNNSNQENDNENSNNVNDSENNNSSNTSNVSDNNENSNIKETNTKTPTTLPKTGQNVKGFAIVIMSFIVLIFTAVKIYKYKDVK